MDSPNRQDLEQYLDLLLGPKSSGFPFHDPDSRRAAWKKHRDVVMNVPGAGSRPSAWWEYEAPPPVIRSPAPGGSHNPRIETTLGYLTVLRSGSL
jgi:hypothetical protein